MGFSVLYMREEHKMYLYLEILYGLFLWNKSS